MMNTPTVLAFLFVAALFEAGGDALVRSGLHSHSALAKGAFFALGAAVLFAYGYLVNAPTWDFGRLLGVYVVWFFVVAQLISWLVFHQKPSPAILIGGSLILAGGGVVAFMR